MAADKVVTAFRSDLRKLSSDLDTSLSGLRLCMIFQRRHPANPRAWDLCVVAESLDSLTDRGAIAFILGKIEQDCSLDTYRNIDRIIVLRTTDRATSELLGDIETEDDAHFLIGRTIYGAVVARMKVFLLRTAEQVPQPEMNAVA